MFGQRWEKLQKLLLLKKKKKISIDALQEEKYSYNIFTYNILYLKNKRLNLFKVPKVEKSL